MLVISAAIHKMLASISNRQDTDHDGLGFSCLSMTFWLATSLEHLPYFLQFYQLFMKTQITIMKTFAKSFRLTFLF